MMRYMMLSTAILICLLAGGFGAWRAFQSAQSPFILSDATAVQVSQSHIGTTLIAYHADPHTWKKRLTRQLIQSGWQVRSYANPGSVLYNVDYVTWYTRNTQLGPLLFYERTQLFTNDHDPTLVMVQIERHVAFRP